MQAICGELLSAVIGLPWFWCLVCGAGVSRAGTVQHKDEVTPDEVTKMRPGGEKKIQLSQNMAK